MTAHRISGWVALVSGGLIALGLVAVSLGGTAWTGTTLTSSTLMGPGMMTGTGTMPMLRGGMMQPGGAGMRGMMPGFGGTFTSDGPIANATEVRVQARNFGFDPAEVRLPKDRPVNLTLVNTTAVLHDLTVPALGIQVVAPAGATRTVGVPSIPAGRYIAYCSVPGHADAGMRATLIVE